MTKKIGSWIIAIIVILVSTQACSSQPSVNVTYTPTGQTQVVQPKASDTLLPSSTYTPAPSDTSIPTRPPTETPNPNLIKSGTYLVNSEIMPGIYRGEGFCYWQRLKDVSGSFDAIIANGNTEGQFYVEVKESDFAFSIDCEIVPLESLSEPTGEYPQVFQAGTYLVGRDIPPGIYRGEGSCYWQRSKDVSGGFDAIIANDNTEGQFYVEVKESDFAFSIDCEIVPLESLSEPTGEYPQVFQAGTYLVGRDIPPGTYRGEGGCYWQRLKDVSGGFDSIIANGNTEGQFYIEVKESDFAFSINCELVHVGE